MAFITTPGRSVVCLKIQTRPGCKGTEAGGWRLEAEFIESKKITVSRYSRDHF
jgi:hypothetical protein